MLSKKVYQPPSVRNYANDPQIPGTTISIDLNVFFMGN